jgi:formylglycine-generating enzyme required for sulfatase activity
MRAEAPAPGPEDSAAAAPSATDHDGELPLMFRECPVCPTMRQMAIGHYTQGSDASEVGRLEDEGPQHAVEFNHAFAVGVTEVTFAEWDACVADKGCSYVPPDEGWGRGRRPVINVSWQDTQDYLQWLSKKTGKRYRLLTEAEWEFAARNDTTTPFSTGKTITTDQANFNGTVTYGGSRKGLYRKKTVEAGSLRPKGFLHDLHGNVWEWVEDCFERYSDDPSDGAAVTAANCDMRVMRGGAWNSPPAHLRSAMRGRTDPVRRDSSIGFRVARTLRLPSLEAE